MSLGAVRRLARAWFEDALGAPTPVQAMGWARIARRRAHADARADRQRQDARRVPAGASIGWCASRAATLGRAGCCTCRRSRRSPTTSRRTCARRCRACGGSPSARGVVVPELRDRRAHRRHARRASAAGSERAGRTILITTPESLYLLLGSRARGDAALGRDRHRRRDPRDGADQARRAPRAVARAARARSSRRRRSQRIGLSATQRPLDEVARFLGGDRLRRGVVDAGMRPRLDLEIVVPVPDMSAPPPPARRPVSQSAGGRGSRGDRRHRRGRRRARHLAARCIRCCSTSIPRAPIDDRRSSTRAAPPSGSRRRSTELARASGRVSADAELVRAHHGSVARHSARRLRAA